MEHKDYYKILGVPRDADSAAIKRAYRNLARRYHPDLNAGDAEAERTFKEINEAYTVLADGEKRRKYDQFGATWQRRATDNFDWSQWFDESDQEPPRQRRPRTSTEEFDRTVNRGRTESGNQSGFSDFFQNFFGGNTESGSRSHTARTGPIGRGEQTLPVEITLEEAFWGTARTIQQGSERFEITIPKGVKTGSRVRISRGQNLSQLTLLVTISPHAVLERKDDDLRTQIKVDLYTALLGGEIQIPTLEGPLLLVVPPNTQNGRTFRLKNQGMPLLKTPDRRGDLYAEIDVELPVPLSDEERRRFLELRRLRQASDNRFA